MLHGWPSRDLFCRCLVLLDARLVVPPSPKKPFYAREFTVAFMVHSQMSLYIYFFMWLRFTIPRYRFEQLMRLG